MSDFAEKLVILFLFFFGFLCNVCAYVSLCVRCSVSVCIKGNERVCVWLCMLCRTDIIAGVYVFGGVFHWCG